MIRPQGHRMGLVRIAPRKALFRSEEHTSELQSQSNLVCRLLLEKKKTMAYIDLLPDNHTRLAVTAKAHPPQFVGARLQAAEFDHVGSRLLVAFHFELSSALELVR